MSLSGSQLVKEPDMMVGYCTYIYVFKKSKQIS